MKNKIISMGLFLILTGSIFNLMSCKKEESLESASNNTLNTSDWSMEKKVSYTTKHFKKIGKIINQLWVNNNTKVLMIDKLNKKVSDGNHETSLLISDIYNIISKSSAKKQIPQKLMNELKDEINAFKGIDEGKDVLPQLYFPFYDLSKGKAMKTNQSSNPVFVMAIDPNEPDELPAYEADANGDLVEQSYTINEEDAQNMDNLIVLNINEQIIDPGESGGTGGSGGSSTVYGDWHKLVMRDLALDRHHESWAKGASEVTFKAVGIRYGYGYDPSDPDDYNFTIHDILSTRRDSYGCFVGKVRRADITNKKLLRFNQVYTNMFIKYHEPSIHQEFGPYYSDIHEEFNDGVFVVMYEYDSWPTAPSDGYFIEPQSYDNYQMEKVAFVGDPRLKYQTSGEGVYGVYWILNASIAPLNVFETDENFALMDGISEIKHDCTSVYHP